MAGVSTDAPLAHVRALWRPEQFTRVSNPGFETNTTGWSVSEGINQPGTSITRITTDFHSGTACGSLVCPAANFDAGVNFDLGTDRYYSESPYGTTYAAVVWLKRVSGGKRAKIWLGSEVGGDTGSLIVELSDSWRAYRVLWRPGANYTDVQFAVTNAQADALTVRIDDVAVYALDAFSQVENSNFFDDTTGYSIAGVISAAATSLTRITTDGMDPETQTCATLVTTSTSGSGADFNLGNRLFTSGRTYTLRVALKSVSGSTSARLRLGSLGTSADRGDAAITLTTSWAIYSVNWTASGNRTDVKAAISNGAASVMTANVGLVEVYEASDDISAPYLGRMNIKRGENFDGSASSPGSATITLGYDARRFDPHYTSSPIYGSVAAGRRIWARASYSGAVYGLFFGTLRSIEPRVWDNEVDLYAEDPFFDFSLQPIADPSFVSRAYWEMRGIQARGVGMTYSTFSHASSSGGIDKTGPESGSFYMQGDTSTDMLSFLGDLNEATGTAHYIKPRATSERLWSYTTVNRASLTDATASDETVNDDFNDLTGYRFTDDALENHQFVPWQSYERLADLGTVVQAAVRSSYGGDTVDEEDPYLHYTDERYGSNSNVPQPMFETTKHRIRRHHKEHHNEHRHKTPQRHFRVTNRRIFPDGFVPLTIPAGQARTVTIDFDIPMAGSEFCVLHADDGSADQDDELYITTSSTATPRQIVCTMLADSQDRTIDLFQVYATPSEPADILLEERAMWDSILDKGDHVGPSFSTPYIPDLASAQGIGDYRNWRYGTGRLRLGLKVEHRFPSIVQRELTDHITLNAARWNIAGVVFVIRALEMDCSPDRLWTTTYQLEELPGDGGPWVVIDGTAAQGVDGTATLAY